MKSLLIKYCMLKKKVEFNLQKSRNNFQFDIIVLYANHSPGLIHPNFYLDKPAPKPSFTTHFCAMTRPSDEIWPFDLQKVMAAQSGSGPKVDKMDSERALLAFLLAKVGKLDPDIVIGESKASLKNI